MTGFYGRIEGAKGDGRGDGRRQEVADDEDQSRGIEGKGDGGPVHDVVGGDDVQLVGNGLCPIEEHLANPFSLGNDQGAMAEVFWGDGCFLCQGIVAFHEQAPKGDIGQRMGSIRCLVRPVEEDDEIQTAVVEAFDDVRRIADMEGKTDLRILLMKG